MTVAFHKFMILKEFAIWMSRISRIYNVTLLMSQLLVNCVISVIWIIYVVFVKRKAYVIVSKISVNMDIVITGMILLFVNRVIVVMF